MSLRIIALFGVLCCVATGCQGEIITDADGNLALAWDAPTLAEDGTPLTTLAGFQLYVDTASPVDGVGGFAIDVGNVTQYEVQLGSGTHHVAVLAYDAAALQSTFSNELTIQVP